MIFTSFIPCDKRSRYMSLRRPNRALQVPQYSWKNPITQILLLKYDGPIYCPYVSEEGFTSSKEKSFCADTTVKNIKKISLKHLIIEFNHLGFFKHH